MVGERLLGHVLIALWLTCLTGALVVVTSRLPDARVGALAAMRPPPLSQLETRLLNVVTLGYRGLFDDLADIWLLQYLADPQLKAVAPAQLYKTVHMVTRHHPKIESLYMLACFALVFDLQAPQFCAPLALDGMQALPASWRIPAMQGFVFAFKMNDPPQAAMYYGVASTKPQAPAFLASYSDKLARQEGLDLDELKQTMHQLLEAPGGSRIGEYLRDHSQERLP